MKTKESIRKTILAKRKLLSPDEIASKSTIIRKKVLRLIEFQQSGQILCYISKDLEVDTHLFIEEALRHDRTVYVPITLGHGIMEWSKLISLENLISGPFGVSEPASPEIETPPVDAPVIVPCLAFSSSRHRIGYGGGYFDRFLNKHKGPKIGLAFEMQHVDLLPSETHDIRLDMIITESGIYS